MVKNSVNSTKGDSFPGTKTLNYLVEVGIRKVAAFATIKWWKEGSLKSEGTVLIPHGHGCGFQHASQAMS